MHIKWENDKRTMSSNLVCENYSDMKHFNNFFTKVGDNKYHCDYCGAINIFKKPVLVHDTNGRLMMQVSSEIKEEEIE